MAAAATLSLVEKVSTKILINVNFSTRKTFIACLNGTMDERAEWWPRGQVFKKIREAAAHWVWCRPVCNFLWYIFARAYLYWYLRNINTSFCVFFIRLMREDGSELPSTVGHTVIYGVCYQNRPRPQPKCRRNTTDEIPISAGWGPNPGPRLGLEVSCQYGSYNNWFERLESRPRNWSRTSIITSVDYRQKGVDYRHSSVSCLIHKVLTTLAYMPYLNRSLKAELISNVSDFEVYVKERLTDLCEALNGPPIWTPCGNTKFVYSSQVEVGVAKITPDVAKIKPLITGGVRRGKFRDPDPRAIVILWGESWGVNSHI